MSPSKFGRRSMTFGVAATMLAMTVVASPLPALGATAACVPTADPATSVARIWDEAALDAIRRDLPRPTVHARNLFHVSVAMWDAWTAYDPVAAGYIVTEKHTAADREAARRESISYAAYRVLIERYRNAIGGPDSLSEFHATMRALCYPTDVLAVLGDTPAAIGNRIAEQVIAYGLTDGSNEESNYAADASYTPVNDPLIVSVSGTTMKDPNRWQPLALDKQIAQNGVFIPDKIQKSVTPFWGHVVSFGLPASPEGLPVALEPQPRLHDPVTDAQFKAEAVEVILRSSYLTAGDGETMDISPGSLGNNDLGTDDGDGYSINPVSGEPYPSNVVPRGDFARALTEFWADGPASETPPGHWNTIANAVADSPGFVRRIGGSGPELVQLEWDVKAYLALNGALHDAAVAAWGAKGYFDSARPISMIRYMGELGQSSDRRKPSYNADGLPLVPGLIELVTKASSRPGHKHAALAGHVGEIAIRAWQGNPDDPRTQVGGVGWILAVDWTPYQKATFVTPAFAGYVSGHSAFSRAGAEVMTSLTGSAFFPGGMSAWTTPAGSLGVEVGPTVDVTLQWATYYDAADQAGISRLFGGIHVPADDFGGRVTGSLCGKAAWALANRYFDGSARS